MPNAPQAPGDRGAPAWLATAGLTTLAMVAFAANSLLARQALRGTTIDAASYTAIRLVSGAVALWLLGGGPRSAPRAHGNWISACALFVYAIAFSFAYRQLTAATGALLLFGAVQTTMLGRAWFQGERFTLPQAGGLFLALAGFVGLVLPGLSAPPLSGSVLMIAAGAAWGVYSLRGRGVTDPLRATSGNFLRSAPIALAVALLTPSLRSFDRNGVLLAIASGVLASGVGYSIWYMALPKLQATQASIVQLSVPVLATAGAIGFLGESITPRITLASAAILGGIALVILQRGRRKSV